MNTDQRRAKLNELIGMRISIPHTVWTSINADTLPTELRPWEWGAALWDRPARSTWPYNDHDLEHAQTAWDASSTFVTNAQEMESERKAQETARQAERDAEYAAQRETERAALANELKAAYLAQPGTSEAGFVIALPEMLERRAQENALASIGTAKSPIPRSQMF